MKGTPLSLSEAITSLTHDPFNPSTYAQLLHQCTTDHRLLRAAHARLLHHSIAPSNFLATKLISFYSRSGRILDARNVFDRIPQPNLFAYNSMLLAYNTMRSPHPHSSALLSSLPPHLKPDAFSLSVLLKSSPPSHLLRPIHAFALRNILLSDLFVANGLISAYGKTGNLRSARLLFDTMPSRDIVSWNSIISAYAHSGHYDQCLRLYHILENGVDGVLPNGVTVACVLHACAHLQDLVSGMTVHKSAVDSGIVFDNVVWNSVVAFYAKCGSLDYARALFEEMPERDAVSYNTLISGYMSYGFVDKALGLFRRMADPVISSWNAVIAGLVQNKPVRRRVRDVSVDAGFGFPAEFGYAVERTSCHLVLLESVGWEASALLCHQE
ncbi:pentatricopeptide repeat-containing protein [Iris pallida]|uniref:Pentatricopeptide repeat-containing protein n=1 Tax=Iris pallida TaxID=29817 RepID=A0AAX6H1H5_IRIPA|nr:pentatricopeptide repeat-containing protein [Iris pallida]